MKAIRWRPIGRLLGLAYRMLGSRSDADDVVQDAYIRFAGAGRPQSRGLPGHRCDAALPRPAQNRKSAARNLRRPLAARAGVRCGGARGGRCDRIGGDLSLALLLALDRLSPLERAAFLLHDVFDVPFSEIARVLDRTEAACRQLATRGPVARCETPGRHRRQHRILTPGS
jgi:RNA polymerase sigma-70 factor, ECF subfamily